VVAAHFGGGATSEGDFHEAMNFAGVFDTPTLFCCHNNGWAISIPESRQTASDTFAEKAGAYGFEGIRVDGMDPLASYAVTKEAADRARRNEDDSPVDAPRPALIEFLEYRFGAHDRRRSDRLPRPRRRRSVARARSARPDGGVPPGNRADRRRRGRGDPRGSRRIVADAIDFAESVEPDPADMFDHAYADLPPELRRQRDELLAAVDEHGEGRSSEKSRSPDDRSDRL